MKKLLLTAITCLGFAGATIADCPYTWGWAGSWSGWLPLPSGDMTDDYTCGSCGDDLSPTYCTSYEHSPTVKIATYEDGGWEITLQGGSCTDHGTAACQIEG
jgi:hypothetical protein